jgi:heptosyltransferase-1
MQKPSRILIVRLSAIGDVIMASGLIPSLRETFPDARIAWLTDAVNADLLQHNPRLDRVYLWPRSRWRRLREQGQYLSWLQEAAALVRSLRAEDFDLVLDLQGLLKSGAWAFLAGGRRRIGLGSREGSRFLMTEVLDRGSGDPRIGSEYRRLAESLGARPGSFALDIAVAPEDQAAAAGLLRAEGIQGGYAAFCPFTTRPQKHWFDERWAELAAGLADATGLTPVMLGGPGDRARAEAIRSQSRGPLADLAGKTSLGVCAALLGGARLAIGVDTGLTHLGIASGIPTLALFGSTRPYLDTGSDLARVLYDPLECSPCRRRPTCDGRFDCMRLHTPDGVLAAALDLLGSERTAAAAG